VGCAVDRRSDLIRAAHAVPVKAELATRAAVADDGEAIRLTLYDDGCRVAAIVFDPVRAADRGGFDTHLPQKASRCRMRVFGLQTRVPV
jgi:hypothetical protein